MSEFPVVCELFIDGAWVDVSDRLRSAQPAVISRGIADEAYRASPGTATVLLANNDGALSADNPESDWWPHVRRGTQMRLSVVANMTTHVRFVGNVASIDYRWVQPLERGDTTLPDVMRAEITAAGTLRRLEQGDKPQPSTLRRFYDGFLDRENVRAYWPMEDGPDASGAASPIEGVEPMLVTMDMGTDDTLPASEPLPSIGGGEGWGFNGLVPRYPAGTWRVSWVCRLPALAPAKRIMQIHLEGGNPYVRFDVVVSATQVELHGIDSDGTATVYAEANTGFFDITGSDWVHVEVGYNQGATSNVGFVRWYRDGVLQGDVFTTLLSGAVGRVRSLQHVTPIGPSDGYSMGHVIVVSPQLTDLLAQNMGDVVSAFIGERAGDRFLRLCDENDVDAVLVGDAADTPAMGPQQPANFLDLLEECAVVDQGFLYEQRIAEGLEYRTRTDLLNQASAVTFDVISRGLHEPFEPVLDDGSIVNDVTVSRLDGSDHREIDQDSIDTEGIYDTSVTANVATDDQLPDQANWRLHLGTWPDMRHRSITTSLGVAGQAVIDAWVAADLGDRLTATNLPEQHALTAEALMRGYTEELNFYQWMVTANTEPYGPYQVGVLGGVTPDTDNHRLVPDPTTITAALNATATTFTGRVDGPTPWINSTDYADQFPLAIIIGGEEMTATAITAPVDATVTDPAHITDTFTRTESGDWGTSDTADPWNSIADPADTTVAVNGTKGTMTLTSSPGNIRRQLVGDDATDAEVLVSVSVDQIATGDSLLPAAIFRHASLNNFYRVRALFNPDATIELQITRTSTALSAEVATGLTYVANEVFWLRAQCEGHTVRARLWADGDPEPSTWTVTHTVTAADGLIETGQVGIAASGFAGNTNVSPVLSYDNFEASTIAAVLEQDFTVTRSVNDVTKQHAAGASVEVVHPLRLI